MVNANDMTSRLEKELAFTEKELAELERARKMPITFDEDCPEVTPEKALKFRRVNPPRKRLDAHGAQRDRKAPAHGESCEQVLFAYEMCEFTLLLPFAPEYRRP